MAKPHEELQAELRRASAETDRKLRQAVRSSLTAERLQADWEQLRGTDQSNPIAQRERKFNWQELLDSLWLARLPQKVAWSACFAALLLAGWFALLPGAIRLHTPAGSLVAGLSLPRELRVTKGGKRVVLQEPGLSLASDLERGRGGTTDDLRVYDLRLEWRNPAGETVVFTGNLVVTNAPGSPPKLTKAGVRGALLSGELKVGDQPWQPYRQSYTP